jgi:hypothetical protein
VCLRAVRTVAALTTAAQRAIVTTDVDLDSFTPIAPAEL